MRKPASLCLFFVVLSCLSKFSFAGDTLTANQSISNEGTLISAGGTFQLGFFSPGNSRYRYLGIWYKSVPERTFVWVANREAPLMNSTGIFKIGDQGNLVIVNGTMNSVIWSSNRTEAVDPVVQLLDTGNLVLREVGDGDSDYLWQSFDYPSDTLLPGMKLGLNLRTGLNRSLSSWKSSDDPSPGNCSFKMDPNGFPQVFSWRQSTKYARSGPWNGIQFSGIHEMRTEYIFKYEFVFNQDEIYYKYEVTDHSLLSRLTVTSTGQVERLTWINGTGGTRFWNSFWSIPADRCDEFNRCGPYGICDLSRSTVCNCMRGFEPKSPEDWYLNFATGGCIRKRPMNCTKGDGFLKLERMKLPDTSKSLVDMNMTLKQCEDKCLRNCSCMAYSAADIRGGGGGCIIWDSELLDLRQYSENGQDLYVRIAASEQDDSDKRRRAATIASATIVSSVLSALIIGYWAWRERKKKRNKPTIRTGKSEKSQELPLFDMVSSPRRARDKSDDTRNEDLGLPIYDMGTIASATGNFSNVNKLGEGGFGPVYKGKLAEGQEIAVKRLSKHSSQGPVEFMNEVSLIAKLQHRNLVRLLGCCIQGEERILIYEYMQNRSLDSILFNQIKRATLDWDKRYNIIKGIARGLVYLHQDSRLRIIHRDLKASNILLDSKMNPKISDFGTARIFGGDETEGNTKKVVGTYGYMSPEYAMDGLFSEKSDVFSFGVLVMEIVSGKKTRGFFHSEDLNLLGHTWKLFVEGKSSELMDNTMTVLGPLSEVMRCVQIGLLCVQERPEDRPTMSAVVLMLGSENSTLPQPKQPGFCAARSPIKKDSSSSSQQFTTVNEVTMTKLEAR